MFNTLAQYFLGTSNNSNNLDPGSKTNHQEVPTNNVDHQHVEQALAQQNVFQVYPNKRGRARRNRKNKVSGAGDAAAKPKGGLRQGPTNPAAGDSPAACASPDFLLHGITTRVCEEEDEEWLFVECAQANKKGGIISLHDDLVEITCLPEEGDALEPPKPRFEIKHNPLNLNQQQLKRQLRQHHAALISCEDIQDDEELMRTATSANGERRGDQAEEIQVIDPDQSAVVEGDSVDVEVPPVAVELPADEAHQQQRQAHGDEELRTDRKQKTAAVAMPKRPMEESWFVTPPSCFTSQGPVQMETSPLENLLIEHPSMSVYHGVRGMDRSADIEESLVVLEKERDEGREDVKMDEQQTESLPAVERTPVHTDKVADDDDDDDEYDSDDEQLEGTAPAVRSERPFDYVCNREAKQGLLFRNAQMNHDKKMRQKLCRNAMTRSNKTTEMNATKNGPKKRSEKQHAKNASRANNNRKCQ